MDKWVSDGHGDARKRSWNWPLHLAIVAVVGVGAFFAIRMATGANRAAPIAAAQSTLRNIECNPCAAKLGAQFLLTVYLNSPVPSDGPAVVVQLSSSDKTALNLNTSVVVEAGQMSASTYAHVMQVPNYLGPLKIFANDGHVTRETEVTVSASAVAHSKPAHKDDPASHEAISAVTTAGPAPLPAQPKPQPLDPGLVSRLEDAQGRLASEKQYWENVKSHMPAGTSIRPEITSLIFSADTTSRRCTENRQSLDATSLQSCVDALNDRLNQLRIQH